MTIYQTTLFFACFAILSPSRAVAEDWSRFRGPNGSGVSSESLPSKLEGNLAWSVEVAFGRSSPVVFGDRLFLTAAEGDSLALYCFAAGDGKLLWRRTVSARRADERVESLNDPASPTPAVDETGIYVFFPDLGVVSFDLDGREKWEAPLGPFSNAYGMTSSPVLAEDLVVMACDQQRDSFLVALDKSSGDVRWKVERPEMRSGWYTPILRQLPGADEWEVIVPGSATIDTYDVRTGKRTWSAAASRAENLGVPLYSFPYLYVNIRGFAEPQFPDWETTLRQYDANGDKEVSREEVRSNESYSRGFNYCDRNRDGVLSEAEWNEMRMVGVGGHGMTAFDLTSAPPDRGVAWRFQKNLPYVPAPLLYEGIVYLVKNGGIVTSLDAGTGQLLKEGRTRNALGNYFASPVAAGGRIYLASEEGKLTVIDAGPDWSVREVVDLGSPIYATPAIAGGALVVRTKRHLYCFRDMPGATSAAGVGDRSLR